jgi:hypothetical protein
VDVILPCPLLLLLPLLDFSGLLGKGKSARNRSLRSKARIENEFNVFDDGE